MIGLIAAAIGFAGIIIAVFYWMMLGTLIALGAIVCCATCAYQIEMMIYRAKQQGLW